MSNLAHSKVDPQGTGCMGYWWTQQAGGYAGSGTSVGVSVNLAQGNSVYKDGANVRPKSVALLFCVKY